MEPQAAEGAGAGAEAGGAKQPRRGPAPIASFDHDGSDESSPESKRTFRLPEIREHPAGGGASPSAPAEARARSHSTPGAGALPAPAPRIDISRASSSSHHDSRDSSPELALFAGDAGDGRAQRLELGFREDGALDLRSSTEELSFLEPASTPAPAAAPAPPAPAARRHSRKDSQCSEAALLAVSGRTSRLSSVGSACSARSAISRASRLSVASGASRSPSPHRMLLETSFCGPKPIETDPEACVAAVAERILEIAKMSAQAASAGAAPAVDARDRREVRTEVTVEATRATRQPALALEPVMAAAPRARESRARPARGEARPRVEREPSEPEVRRSANRSKDIIRIKLRPDDEEDSDPGSAAAARKPSSLALGAGAAPPSPAPGRRRSPSPPGAASVSRKSSFCSLFRSRETIGSPDSPHAQEALRRKRSLTEGRARSESRDRSATPTSSRIRGSVLSLFRTPRKSVASSSPGSRATSPAPAPAPAPAHPARPPDARAARDKRDKLKYYEEAKNGVIHIPLRTPPEERARRGSGPEAGLAAAPAPRPASAPQARAPAAAVAPRPASAAPTARTVLPDGSIIIPLRSPTERAAAAPVEPARPRDPTPPEPSPASRAPSAATSPSSLEAAAGPAEPAASPPAEPTSARRKERLAFATRVGSRDQVFSTQFSVTETASVASEISGSFASFDGGEPRDARAAVEPEQAAGAERAPTPPEPPRDESESEPSSEAAPPQAGSDVERRGLVVQESFEDELPYVPTTLPQERSVAVPMVPVRERGAPLVRGVRRPRAPAAASPAVRAPAAVPAPAPAPADADKLRIKLPRRPRVSSAPSAPRERTRSGGAPDGGGENRTKREWIDFEEVPERRKQPKRIQTLPVGADDEGAVFSYVEPEHCRCECHAQAQPRADDQLPLLADEMQHSRISSSSAECGEEEAAHRPPFTADLDLRHAEARPRP